ncbi:hypothetical protein AMECASPLE_008046 [Ameca splendens]|uniref:Secreted protein n=1 Tax=Ameca splendens TaxID=208324 RepID=A0ABV0ZW45_9TELE
MFCSLTALSLSHRHVFPERQKSAAWGPAVCVGFPVCAASRTSGEQKSCTVNSVLVTGESTEWHREGGSTCFDRQRERTHRWKLEK